MNDYGTLEKLVVGLRHERTFHVLDVLGNIVDQMKLLQGTGSFPDGCFKSVLRTNEGIVLRDSEKDFSISAACNIDGVIFECDMLTEPPTSKNDALDMFNTIVQYVLPMYEGGKRINRLGIVHQVAFPSEGNAAKQIMSKIFKDEFKGYPDSVVIRAVLKHPTMEAIELPSKSVSYKTAIVEVKSRKDSESKAPSFVEVAIDYQIYFDPEVQLSQISITKHSEEADAYIEQYLKGRAFDFTGAKAQNV